MITQLQFVKKRNVYSKLKFCSTLIFILVGTEILLRTVGFKPGDLRPSLTYFKPVDSLYEISDFVTNSEGVLVANQVYFKKQGVFINQDGFRTKSFTTIDNTKRKIMFIGDSFTWGMSAEPFFKNSFCDLLAQDSSLEIINLGIPAADPVQYFSLSEKYIPQLTPNVLYVMFYMGNDLMRIDRTNTGQPYYYWTNAGAIYTDIDGLHFTSSKEAYDYLVTKKLFIRQPKNKKEWLVSKSALLARLFSLKFRWKEKQEFEKARNHPQLTVKYLNRIAEICVAYNCELNIVIIPEAKDANLTLEKYYKKYGALLNDATLHKYFYVPNVQPEWYGKGDNPHLNNLGHFAYYQLIKGITNPSQ